MHERPQWCNCPIRIQETRLPILGSAGVSVLILYASSLYLGKYILYMHRMERKCASTRTQGDRSKEMVRNSWDILNTILGHIHHQNHSNRVIYSEWSQYSQQKWLWLQSVNGLVLSTQSIVLQMSALRKCAPYSETRSRSTVWKKHTHTEGQTWWNSISVAKFGFIHFVQLCLDDSDIYDLQWCIKCPKNFGLSPWILLDPDLDGSV